MKISHLLSTLILSSVSLAASAVPIKSGIQTNVAQASYLSAGWKEVSATSTAQYASIASMVAGIGQKDRIAVGVRNNANGQLLVVAETTLESFQTKTAFNQTHDDNGVSWYYNAFSVGFTQLGAVIQQSEADIKLHNSGNLGLSWHAQANGQFNASLAPTTFFPGWAANNGSYVSTWSDQYSRIIMTAATDAAVPEPASIALMAFGVALVAGARRRKS